MKKVIIGAAALLFGVVGFAQSNTGTAEQDGSDNLIRVRQIGALNNAELDQDGDNNQAGILQTGLNDAENGAPATPAGLANDAAITQEGDLNAAFVDQDGDYNVADIEQTSPSGTDEGNRAYIQQGVGYAVNNEASISQDGSGNDALTRQFFDSNVASTVQEGDDNDADIRQNAPSNDAGAGPASAASNIASVEQYGDLNGAFVRQNTNPATVGGFNLATIVQDGDDNYGYQTQDGDTNTAAIVQKGEGNYANQDQDGEFNTGIINQGDGALYSGSLTDFLNGVVFDGSFIPGGVGQSGFDYGGLNATETAVNDKAYQVQEGFGNYAEAHQFGRKEQTNTSIQMQSGGGGNQAFVAQNNNGTDAGDANYAKQVQTGAGTNGALTVQWGKRNDAETSQDGFFNAAVIAQRWSDNDARTVQEGDFHQASTEQWGVDGFAVIKQEGTGHRFAIQQGTNAPGAASTGNQISVLQQDAGGDGFLDNEYCEPIERMEMDMPMPDLDLKIDLDLCDTPPCV
ncbi:hypothetical protein [Croceiramulus getboli]|nr:hypothetical protein P8624_08035 [Flavobacteriaceae bacterium YJPT1-3]